MIDITNMTTEELKALQKNIHNEIKERYKTIYNNFEEKLIQMLKDFEEETGLYLGFDMGDYEDTAINVIKAYMYYSTEYIEPYE